MNKEFLEKCRELYEKHVKEWWEWRHGDPYRADNETWIAGPEGPISSLRYEAFPIFQLSDPITPERSLLGMIKTIKPQHKFWLSLAMTETDGWACCFYSGVLIIAETEASTPDLAAARLLLELLEGKE